MKRNGRLCALALVFACLIAIALSGCNNDTSGKNGEDTGTKTTGSDSGTKTTGSDTGTKAGGDSGNKTYTIGMSQCNLGEPWRVQMNKDIEEAAAKHPEIKL